MDIDPKQANTVQALTEHTEEVALILMKNVETVQERAGKLADADERAEALKESSEQFEKTSIRMKLSHDKENCCCSQVFIRHVPVIVLFALFFLIFILIGILMATGVIPVVFSNSSQSRTPSFHDRIHHYRHHL
ncbi:unnamed protein product [Arctogadus glacialis]